MSKGQIPHKLMEELRSYGWDAEADGTIQYQEDSAAVEREEPDNTKEVCNMDRSRTDRAAVVVGRVTGKSIVAMENAATTTGRWIKDTGAPNAIKVGKGIGRFLSKFASEVRNEVRAASEREEPDKDDVPFE